MPMVFGKLLWLCCSTYDAVCRLGGAAPASTDLVRPIGTRHDVIMVGVPLPLGLSRLFRNIPQRHTKLVTDF